MSEIHSYPIWLKETSSVLTVWFRRERESERERERVRERVTISELPGGLVV